MAKGVRAPAPPKITQQPMVKTRKNVPINSVIYFFMFLFLRAGFLRPIFDRLNVIFKQLFCTLGNRGQKIKLNNAPCNSQTVPDYCLLKTESDFCETTRQKMKESKVHITFIRKWVAPVCALVLLTGCVAEHRNPAPLPPPQNAGHASLNNTLPVPQELTGRDSSRTAWHEAAGARPQS